VRLTHRVVEIFHTHKRVASHVRRSQRSGHVTVHEHMPKSHQRHANITPDSLIAQAGRIGSNVGILVERMLRERRHPEQGYRSAMGIISLSRRYDHARLEAACERALSIDVLTYSSVNDILQSGLDCARPVTEPGGPAPAHTNIRGHKYYQ
jgi:transposase